MTSILILSADIESKPEPTTLLGLNFAGLNFANFAILLKFAKFYPSRNV